MPPPLHPVPPQIPSAHTHALLDPDGTLTADAPCRRCSYNLRGLNQNGRCPECGTPVGLSIQGDLLRFADPAWVEKLADGVRFTLWGILVNIVGGFLGGLVFHRVPAMQSAVALLAGLVGIYGAWLLTSPDPSGIGEDPNLTARKIVRFSLLVGLASSLAQIIVQGVASRQVVIALLVIGVVAGSVGVVGEFAKIYYLEKLALRIPDLQLAQRAKFLRWAYGTCLAVVVVFGALLALAAALSGSRPDGAILGFACVVGIAGLAMLVFGIMLLVFLYNLGQALRTQAALARDTWLHAATPAASTTPPAP